MSDKRKPATVEIAERDYDPTQAEMNENIKLDMPEGMTVSEAAKALMQPVNLKHVKRPRKKQ